MQLQAASRGRGPRVVLVHGFTQTHESWDPVTADLATDHEVVVVDAPGHGGSAGVRTDLWAGADLLADVGGRATYVGYSMGARLVLHLALGHPDLVERLVLLSGTAGIDAADERSARRLADERLAAEVERVGTERFLEGWLTQPIFEGLTPAPADLAARRANAPSGLASSLRLAGTGTMDPPLWDRLHEIAAPVLVVAGARDAKFGAVGERLVDGLAGADRLHVVDGAGHAAHLEQPAAFAAMVRRFVADREPGPVS